MSLVVMQRLKMRGGAAAVVAAITVGGQGVLMPIMVPAIQQAVAAVLLTPMSLA
jgi:hypothetical protein